MAQIKNIFSCSLRVTMPDGSKYDVPVEVIARSRAGFYSKEFGGDVVRSLVEDTVPLFEEDDFNVQHWAQNYMDWGEVKDLAVQVKDELVLDEDYFQKGWLNGPKQIVLTRK